MIARQERDRHTSASALGDAHAIAAVQKARAEQSHAEARLADLFNRRWPAAQRELVAAEQAAGNAKRALARPHVEALKRQRVKAASRIDAALAEAASAYGDFERLGLELQSYDLGDSGMVSRGEGYRGLQRMYSALPECLRSLPANPTAKFIPLAESEAQFWSLPPEPEKVKAA